MRVHIFFGIAIIALLFLFIPFSSVQTSALEACEAGGDNYSGCTCNYSNKDADSEPCIADYTDTQDKDNPFSLGAEQFGVLRTLPFNLYVEEDVVESGAGKEVLIAKMPVWAGENTCVQIYNPPENAWFTVGNKGEADFDYDGNNSYYKFSGSVNRQVVFILTGYIGDDSEANTTKDKEVEAKEVIINAWQDEDSTKKCSSQTPGFAEVHKDNFVRFVVSAKINNHYEDLNEESTGQEYFNEECAKIAAKEFQKGDVFHLHDCINKTGGEFITAITISDVPTNTSVFGTDPNNNLTLKTIGENSIEEIMERISDGYTVKKMEEKMTIKYCKGKIEIESEQHEDCEPKGEIIRDVTFEIENTYDEPKAVGCTQPNPRCGPANASVDGKSCFTGTGLDVIPHITKLSIEKDGDAVQEYTARNIHPLTKEPKSAGPAKITLRNLRDAVGNCTKTSGKSDEDVDIVIAEKTDPEGVNIEPTIGNNINGNKVRSITFTASNSNKKIIKPVSWRYWFLSKNAECNDTTIPDWNSGIVKNSATLDEEADNELYVCFGARVGGGKITYKGERYYAIIDTSTYNGGIKFFVAKKPSSAPNVTMSGRAEPGARVEAISVESNGITVPQGGQNFTTAHSTTGEWQVIIQRAIDPDTDTDLVIYTKTTDLLKNEDVQKVTRTISEECYKPGGCEPKTEPTADPSQGGGSSGSARGAPSLGGGGNTDPPPEDSVPPLFTIGANHASIVEGQEIEWTITRDSSNTTEKNFSVSCSERGEWGISILPPSWKDLSIGNPGGTHSPLTMETKNDDTPEKRGSITCSVMVGGSSVSSYSVRVISDDQEEKSILIIDCTFGVEEYTAGEVDTEGKVKVKEQCGVKHLFQLANNIMKLLLWLAITGAGALIFYKGVILAGNVFTKGGHQEARKGMQNALKVTVIGLIFILSAYLIVKAGFDIIGYNLNGGDPFKWDESSLPDVPEFAPPVDTGPQQPGSVGSAGSSPTGVPAGCSGCETKTKNIGGVTFKEEDKLCKKALASASCWVSAAVGDRLQKLASNSEASWRVTEACPPTRGHSNICHTVEHCTCVDANFTDTTEASVENIVAFILAAEGSGFKAVYEVKDGNRYRTLKDAVVGELTNDENNFTDAEAESRIAQVSTIDVDHFSLYSQ